MRNSNKKVLKALAVVLCVLLAYPAFLMSASALDTVTVTEPQIVTATLQSVMEARSDEKIRVAIWLKDYDTEEALATESLPDYETRLNAIHEVERTSTAPNEATLSGEIKRAALRLCYEPYTADFGTDFLTDEETVYCSTYLPIIIAELTPTRIEQMSNLDVVESIDYYCDDVVEEETELASVVSEGELVSPAASVQHYEVESQIQYINAGTLRSSMTSSDYISVGVLDAGNPEDDSAFADIYIELHHPTGTKEQHTTEVMKVFSAIAPYAEFYCATYTGAPASVEANYISEIEWLIECGVAVINISLQVRQPRSGDDVIEDPYNTPGIIAEYLDRISYRYSVLIVKSAGNADATGVNSGGMAYNVLTVGSFNRWINSIADHSSYYSGTVYANKPDISAPGYFTFYEGTNIRYGEGTSYAAPLVAGVATILMATNDYLMNAPDLIKAILMASTNSNHQYTPDDVEYKYYGAGVIDAENARVISTSSGYRSSVCATTVNGYNEYTISVSAGSVVRIAMAFQKIDTVERAFDLGNLDLTVHSSTGTQLDYSTSYNNNVEIVEFTAPNTGTYKVKVITKTIHQDGNVTVYDSYALAWSIGGN